MKTCASVLVLIAALAGCSSDGKSGGQGSNAPPPPKPTETLTGRVAFQKMYVQSRAWTPDAQGYLEESQPTKDAPGTDGKSAVWSARFGSASRSKSRGFVWSGSDGPDAPSRGLTASGPEDTFSTNNFSTHIFDVGFLKSDTDQAFKVAQEHGGNALLQKDRTLPVSYRLEWSSRDYTVAWHVIYGSSKLSVAVDATTGKFLRVDK